MNNLPISHLKMGMPTIITNLALRVWGSPLYAGIAASFAYAAIAFTCGPSGLAASRFPFFSYLSEAFLNGHLALISLPHSQLDLVVFNGQYYLYWPPLPAALFMPLVAVFGTGVSDVLVTLLLAGANVALVSALLQALGRSGLVDLSLEKRAWLTVFFALGTAQLSVAPYGRVWFTAQTISVGLIVAAYLAAISLRKPLVAWVVGSLVSAAFLTRNAMIASLLWPAWYLLWRRRESGRWLEINSLLGLTLPFILALLFTGWYNNARFGSPTETGIAYHLMNNAFRQNYESYGAFNIQYLTTNAYYSFIAVPYQFLISPTDSGKFFMGGSLFLMSPVFLLAPFGVVRSQSRGGLVLLTTWVFGLLPAMLIMGTGWMTFGPRYTLDAIAPLLVATAIGAEKTPLPVLALLSIASIAIYVPGVLLLGRVM